MTVQGSRPTAGDATSANTVMGTIVADPAPSAAPSAAPPNVTAPYTQTHAAGLLMWNNIDLFKMFGILSVLLPLIIGAGLFYTGEYDKEVEQRSLDIYDNMYEYWYGVYEASPHILGVNVFAFISFSIIVIAVIEVNNTDTNLFDGPPGRHRYRQAAIFLIGWFAITFIILNVLYVIKKEENREIEKENKNRFECLDPCVAGQVFTVDDLEFTVPLENNGYLYYTGPDGKRYPLYGLTEPRFGECIEPEHNEGYIISTNTCTETATTPVAVDTDNCAAALDDSACDAVMMDCASGTVGGCPDGCIEKATEDITDDRSDDVTVCAGTSTEQACTHTGNTNLNTGPNEFNVDVKCDNDKFYEPLLWGWWDGGKAEECDLDDNEYILSGCHWNGDMYIFIMAVVVLLIVRFRSKLEVGTKQKVTYASLFLGFFVVLTVSIRSGINGFNLNEKIQDQMGMKLSTMTILISGLVTGVVIIYFMINHNAVDAG